MSPLLLSDPTRHNWWRKLQTPANAGAVEPDLRRMIIRHDADCAIWHDGDCDCDPDIEIDRTTRSTRAALSNRSSDDTRSV